MMKPALSYKQSLFLQITPENRICRAEKSEQCLVNMGLRL